MTDNTIAFRRSPEKGSAINGKGRKIEFSTYLAIANGKPIAKIHGYLRRSGGIGWAVEGIDAPLAIERNHWTLQNAKQAVTRCFARNVTDHVSR